MRSLLILGAVLAGAAAVFGQQPQPNPRQQPNAPITVFAPEQHDLYDGEFRISANRVYME